MTISRRIPQRMRNDSNKSCRQNQNTHFKFSNVFPKIVPFMRSCRKVWWKQRRCKWQYSRALHAGVARAHERKHTPALVHPHTHTCTHTHKLTRVHLRTQKYVILFFSTTTMVSWMRLNFTLHVHCLYCYNRYSNTAIRRLLASWDP